MTSRRVILLFAFLHERVLCVTVSLVLRDGQRSKVYTRYSSNLAFVCIGDHHLRSFVQRQITHSYNSNHQRQSSSLLLEACCNVSNCLQDAQVVHDTYRNEPLLGKSLTLSLFLSCFLRFHATWLLEITIQFARPLRKDMPSFASSTSSDTLVPDSVPEERFAVSSSSLNILA